ncbi:MAG: NPCBM/NEW2 domain-containing protein [Dehalococcoidia bacterium]
MIAVPSPQGSATFVSWSDGGARQHNITVGTSDQTLTATMSAAPPLPSSPYLSDWTWVAMTNGWGPVEKDRSNNDLPAGDGRTITLNGVTYAKGLGTHAPSDIRYAINGGCTSFLADVGVDDEVGAGGSVVFQVWADGVKLYDSGVMTGTTATRAVVVDLTGRNELRLVVTDAGNGLDSDHGDWADARVQCGADTTSPTVPTVLPAAGATGVATGATVQATFSEAIDPATLTTATFTLAPSAGGRPWRPPSPTTPPPAPPRCGPARRWPGRPATRRR